MAVLQAPMSPRNPSSRQISGEIAVSDSLQEADTRDSDYGVSDAQLRDASRRPPRLSTIGLEEEPGQQCSTVFLSPAGIAEGRLTLSECSADGRDSAFGLSDRQIRQVTETWSRSIAPTPTAAAEESSCGRAVSSTLAPKMECVADDHCREVPTVLGAYPTSRSRADAAKQELLRPAAQVLSYDQPAVHRRFESGGTHRPRVNGYGALGLGGDLPRSISSGYGTWKPILSGSNAQARSSEVGTIGRGEFSNGIHDSTPTLKNERHSPSFGGGSDLCRPSSRARATSLSRYSMVRICENLPASVYAAAVRDNDRSASRRSVSASSLHLRTQR